MDSSNNAVLAYLPGKVGSTSAGNHMKAELLPVALRELGYNVDYIDWQNVTWRRRKDYSLFVGHGGYNFMRVANQIPEAKKIYFASGYYWKEFNRLEAERFAALAQRRGVRLPFDRKITVDEETPLQISSGVMCLGGEKSYSGFKNVFVTRSPGIPPVKKENFQGVKHFLFYNGAGNVHKGLDLVLEAFAGTDLQLHVCQIIEPGFGEAYKNELNMPNVHVYGKIVPHGKQFRELVKLCNWVISASCCEGRPNSILECMAYGLIPVTTEGAQIPYGFELPEDIPGIREKCNWITNSFSPLLCDGLSDDTQNQLANNHTPEIFVDDVKNAIRKILQ